MIARAAALALVSFLAAPAAAQQLELRVAGRPLAEAASVRVAVDADDDDEDGVPDAAQEHGVPSQDLLELSLRSDGPIEVATEGSVRLVRGGRPVAAPIALPPRRPLVLHVQGLRASRAAGDARVVVRAGGAVVHRLSVTVVGLVLLDGQNRPLDATRHAAGVSHAITNDASLPRNEAWAQRSADVDNLRVELWDPSIEDDEVRAVVETGPPGEPPRSARTVVLRRPDARRPFRSGFLRLVADEMDLGAPGVGDRVLRVALRDVVRVRAPAGRGGATQSLRVGRPGDEDGPRAARQGRLRVRVLRATPGGMPVVGGDAETALAIGRRQVAIANQVWLQCFAGFGDPDAADVELVDPPAPALLAVADVDGLPARGGGVVRLRAGGRAIRPVRTRPGAPPVQTALDVAAAIRELGLQARVTENPPTERGAGRSADVVVRDRDGHPVALSADGAHPLSTDARQSVAIGSVDLSDGLQEFDNMTATAGTLEERTMVKLLSDDDQATVDLFVVNHFSGGTRQGEAFIEADGGAIVNTVILDRNGIRQEREAWTQSHELGHVLLNQPFHPDNVGPDRPWLLMDADSSLGLVTGPKRLTWDECHRARTHSGANAVPPLLDRRDRRPSTPAPTGPYDLGYPRD